MNYKGLKKEFSVITEAVVLELAYKHFSGYEELLRFEKELKKIGL